MNILLIDPQSLLLDFALRCEALGHAVRHFSMPNKRGEASLTGNGLLTKVREWRPSRNWADLVIVGDNLKLMRELDVWRREGVPVYGPTAETADWELCRQLGQDVMEHAGIAVLPSTTFTDYDQAAAHVRKTMQRYVSKPDGDAAKALSYVSKGPADMLFMLDYWKKQGKIHKAPFILQEFVGGTEFAVGGWFGRNGFSRYFLENFEFKKLMNGEIGVNTGEMGTAMKYCTLEESKLAQEMLLPLQADLARAGYSGYIDVSVIVPDGSGPPGPMEFTCRFGYPLFQIQQALHPEPVQWMADALLGKDTFEPLPGIAVGVVVAIPDFPYTTYTSKQVAGFPVWGISADNRGNIHPIEMMLGKAPAQQGNRIVEESMLVTSGDYVLVTSGVGKTVVKAKDKAYAVLKELEIPNSPMYRTDIGCRLEKQLPKLQAKGYATSWSYD